MMMIAPSRVSFIKQRAPRLAAKLGARDGCRERVLESRGTLTLHSAVKQRHSQVDQDAGGRARRRPTPICRCARDPRRREVSAGASRVLLLALLGLAFSEPSRVLLGGTSLLLLLFQFQLTGGCCPVCEFPKPPSAACTARACGLLISCGASACFGGQQAARQTSFWPMAIPINL